jgi:SAM-dependent methyltransferase
MKLNLGCSDDHRAGYVNVDRHAPADELVALECGWPWPESSIDEIYAHDVFEHLPSKLVAMNQAHFVLKPGGLLDLAVPCVMLADGRVNPGAFADPTHQTFWTMDDKYYFCRPWDNPRDERGRFGVSYNITALFDIERWELVEYGQGAERRSKIMALLRAVK